MLVVEEQPEEVMVGGKLAWRDGGKPSDAHTIPYSVHNGVVLVAGVL